MRARVGRLQRDARARLEARGADPRLQLLLTGATGFLGKEVLAQAAGDRRIAQVVSVVRPETVRDPKTGRVLKRLSPAAARRAAAEAAGHRGRARPQVPIRGGGTSSGQTSASPLPSFHRCGARSPT